MKESGIITKIITGSIAEELEIAPGDRLISVNGQPIQDIIDLSFALADDYIEIIIEKENGEQELLEIEKDIDEDLGLEFSSAVFNGTTRCENNCIFCFVAQMKPGMRQSLYVKDDDYRLSFLYGNFITLTNLSDDDILRIKQLHLSPLYISIHATDGKIREKMLRNPAAAHILTQLAELASSGIQFHTQIVLCPDINDGKILDQTINDLSKLLPNVLSVAVVPVGLTANRDKLFPLRVFSPIEAAGVIEQVHYWQEIFLQRHHSRFVYLADEFYLSANVDIPAYSNYDGFPQLENGIGIVRNFISEWDETECLARSSNKRIAVLCGVSAQKILAPLIKRFDSNIEVIAIKNNFFGSNITVSGLLTAQDIINQMQRVSIKFDLIIVPGIALRKGENVFLDNQTLAVIEDTLSTPVCAAYGAADLKQLLFDWGSM